MYKGLFILLIFFVADTAHAAVRINEVAWMGTDAGGASCEWVELFNGSGETVDLSTWTLTIQNAGSATSKVIALNEEGSAEFSGIAGNGYYLIARDSGSCRSLAPATSADWLGSFGSGISNTGAVLTLSEGSTIVDTIDADGGWSSSIGGKNVSGSAKQTPQYTGNAWITALPTPRSANATTPVDTLPDDHDDVASSTPVVTIGGSTPVVPAVSPIIKLFLEPGPNRVVPAGADTPYEVIVYDATGKLYPHADVTWSFGDGGSRGGKSVSYAYREPGEYLAVVRAREKGQSAVATVSVIAQPFQISMEEDTERGVVIGNHSPTLADLSSWKIKAGKKSFTLPPDTVVPAGKSVLLSSLVTRLPTSTPSELLYPNGERVALHTPEQPSLASESIEERQEVVPAVAAPRVVPTYAKDPIAPAAQAQLAAVGAAVPGKVILKGEAEPLNAIGYFFEDLLASFASFIVR
ncbi:lamin tail domain-containing protein [Patescibacteria group bacterium]|nr:lamin tail domain-containing protein [Patescibacteria group bacterium]